MTPTPEEWFKRMHDAAEGKPLPLILPKKKEEKQAAKKEAELDYLRAWEKKKEEEEDRAREMRDKKPTGRGEEAQKQHQLSPAE